MVKNPPAKQKTQVRSLGQEGPLEKEITTHSSILAWEIPWTGERDRLQSMVSQRVRHNLVTREQQLSLLRRIKINLMFKFICYDGHFDYNLQVFVILHCIESMQLAPSTNEPRLE